MSALLDRDGVYATALFGSSILSSFWTAIKLDPRDKTLSWFVNTVSDEPSDEPRVTEYNKGIRDTIIKEGPTNVFSGPSDKEAAFNTAEYNYMFLRALFNIERPALPSSLKSNVETLFTESTMTPVELAWFIRMVRQMYVHDTRTIATVEPEVTKYTATSTNGAGDGTLTSAFHRALVFTLLARFFTPDKRDPKEAIAAFVQRNNEKDITGTNQGELAGLIQLPADKLEGILALFVDAVPDLEFGIEDESTEMVLRAKVSEAWYKMPPSVSKDKKNELVEFEAYKPHKVQLKVLSDNLKMFNRSIAVLAAELAAKKRAHALKSWRENQAEFLQAKHEESATPIDPAAFATQINSIEQLIAAILHTDGWAICFGLLGSPAWAGSFENMKDQATKLSQHLAVWFPPTAATAAQRAPPSSTLAATAPAARLTAAAASAQATQATTPLTGDENEDLQPVFTHVVAGTDSKSLEQAEANVEAARVLLYWLTVIDQEDNRNGDITLLDEKLGATLDDKRWTAYRARMDKSPIFDDVRAAVSETVAQQSDRFKDNVWWNLKGVSHLQNRRVAISETKQKQVLTVGRRIPIMLNQYRLAQVEQSVDQIGDDDIREEVQSMVGKSMGDRGAVALQRWLEKDQGDVLDAWLQNSDEYELFIREASVPSVAFMRVDDVDYNVANTSPAALFRLLFLIPAPETRTSAPTGVFIGTATIAYHFTECSEEMPNGTFRILREASLRDACYSDMDGVLKAAARLVSGLSSKGGKSSSVRYSWWDEKKVAVEEWQKKLSDYKVAHELWTKEKPGAIKTFIRVASVKPEPVKPLFNTRELPFQGESAIIFNRFKRRINAPKMMLLRTLFDRRLGFQASITSRKQAQKILHDEFVRRIRLDERIADTHTQFVLWTDERLRMSKRDSVFVTYCTSAPHLLSPEGTLAEQAASLVQKIVQHKRQAMSMPRRLLSHVSERTFGKAEQVKEVARVEALFSGEQEAQSARDSGNSVYRSIDPKDAEAANATSMEATSNFTLQFETFVVCDYLTMLELFPIDAQSMRKDGDRRISDDLITLLNSGKYPQSSPLKTLHHVDTITSEESTLVKETEEAAQDDDQRYLQKITERELLEASADASFRTGIVSNTVMMIRAAQYRRMCWLSKLQEKDIVGTLLMFQEQDYRWILLNTVSPDADSLHTPDPLNSTQLPSRVFLYMTVPNEVDIDQRCVVRYTLQPRYNQNNIAAAVTLSGSTQLGNDVPNQFTLVPRSKVILRIASPRMLAERVQAYPQGQTKPLTVFAPTDLWTYTEKACPLGMRGRPGDINNLQLDDDDKARYRPFKDTSRTLDALLLELYGHPCRPLLFNLVCHYLAVYQRFMQSEWLRHLDADERLMQQEAQNQQRSTTDEIEDGDDGVQYYVIPSGNRNSNDTSRASNNSSASSNNTSWLS